MKVLLINPSSRIMQSSRMYKKFVSPIPPVGLGYLASVLEKNGVKVSIVDQVGEMISDDEVVRKALEFSPQIIGFSCLTQVINNTKELAAKIKTVNKSVKIILGNIHPTLFTHELLEEGAADIIVRSEGEHTLLETVLAIAESKDLESVRGISFRVNGKIIHNSDRPLIADIDELPYPAWHLFDLKLYSSTPLISVYDVSLPILASRGCPYRCIFCSQDKIHRTPRYRKIDSIIDEIEYMNDKYNVRSFGFIDPFFPFSVKFGLDFCDRFIERGLHKKIKWVTETRVDLVNFELLKKMKEAGANLIMFGFEVGNQGVLDKLRKGINLEQSRLAMRYAKRVGLMTLGLFMLGMPGDSRKTCEETIKFAKELDCDIVKFNITVPYPGSELFEKNKEKLQKDWERFIAWADWAGGFDPVYVPEGMTAQELINLQRKAMFSYYMRPGIILKNIAKGRTPLKFLLYGALVLMKTRFRTLLSKFKAGLR